MMLKYVNKILRLAGFQKQINQTSWSRVTFSGFPLPCVPLVLLKKKHHSNCFVDIFSEGNTVFLVITYCPRKTKGLIIFLNQGEFKLNADLQNVQSSYCRFKLFHIYNSFIYILAQSLFFSFRGSLITNLTILLLNV